MNNELITKLKEAAWLDAAAMAHTDEHKCHLSSDYFCMLEQNRFAELIIAQCGYYADIFESVGCPADMDPSETKPSDYIKKHFGVNK